MYICKLGLKSLLGALIKIIIIIIKTTKCRNQELDLDLVSIVSNLVTQIN